MASEQSIDIKAWPSVWILSLRAQCAARLPPGAWATQLQEAHPNHMSSPSIPEN